MKAYRVSIGFEANDEEILAAQRLCLATICGDKRNKVASAKPIA